MWEIIIAPWGQKFQAGAGTHTCKIRKVNVGMKKESTVMGMGSWSKNFLWKMKLPLAEGNHRAKRKGTPVQGPAGGSGRETSVPTPTAPAHQGSQKSTPRRGQHVARGWPERRHLSCAHSLSPHPPAASSPAAQPLQSRTKGPRRVNSSRRVARPAG